jgi:hypothetical protein
VNPRGPWWRPWQLSVATGGAALLLLGAGSVVAVHDEARGATALAALEPAVAGLAAAGAWWVAHSPTLTTAVGAGLSALLVGLAWRRRRGRAAAALVATALAVVGEIGLLVGAAGGAAVLLVLGALAMAVASRPDESTPLPTAGTTRPWREAGLLLAVLALATVLRLYALDRVLGWFDGELTGYYAAATRLAGIVLANEGIEGPWAPLGLTFYPPYAVASRLVGTTVLALRLAAAWVGVLSIPLLYLLVRRVAGAPTALTAAALLALDPLSLGWSRSDVHPHGFTLWPVLLVCLATLAALRSGTRRAWCATAVAMGLAWHQYPSGQAAVLIPPLAVALQASVPGAHRRGLRRGLPFLLLGVALWFAGLPLSGWLSTGRLELRNPFTLTGSRAAWSAESAPADAAGRLTLLGRTAVRNAADLTTGLFREARVISRQDFLPNPRPLPRRTLPWTVAVAGLLGAVLLARRRADAGAAVLLAWLAVAPLPAVLSAEAYPKRAATLFPALICAAAVFAAWLTAATWPAPGRRSRRVVAALVGAALLVQVALTCYSWFSGRQWRTGRPWETAAARYVADSVVPGTLIVVDGAFTYLDGKLLYLLLDDLVVPARRPNAYVVFEGDTADFRRIVEAPGTALAYLGRTVWPYRWTRLAGQCGEVAAARDWRRVIWVVETRTLPEQRPNPQHVPLVRAACPGVSERTFPGGAAWAPADLTVLVCESGTARQRAGAVERVR